MEKYLCRVAYIGWFFKGTNVQPDQKTVEGEMEKVLQGKVRFLSRTDAGVSALNNYAVCVTKLDPFTANQIPGIWVVGRVLLREKPKVFWRWYRYYYPEEIEIPQELLEKFRGVHDFASFSIPEGKDTKREIVRITAFTIPGFTVFDVIGKSFLRQMVRRLVMGIVLHTKKEIDALELLEKPRAKSVPPAPPEGLLLVNMGIRPYVPVDESRLFEAREAWKRMWKELKLRSLVLSNWWMLGRSF